MLRLNTLGELSLMHGTVLLRGHTPRQRLLPLLAVLALEPERGVSRGRAAGVLWPDSDAERGRHSLEEVVSQARKLARVAGTADPFRAGSVLALDRSRLTSDLFEFDEALSRSELERAVTIHGGRAFAADVCLDGCDELDRLLQAGRDRIAASYRDALHRLGRRAAEMGDPDGTVRWLRRLVEFDPGDRSATIALLDALEARREAALALAIIERHRQHLEALDLGVDDGIADRARRLHGASHARPPATRDEPAASPASTTVDAIADDALRRRIDRAIAPRFEIVARGARSGSVISYDAVDREAARRRVEVHVVQPQLASHVRPEYFLALLRRAGSVQDASVVPVLGCGSRDGVHYLATPARATNSLRDRVMRDGPLPLGDAMTIARAVAGAMDMAHVRGIVHGDLRPKHIGLRDSHVEVAFFGLADAIIGSREDGERGSVAISIGDAAYRAPEELAGDVRSTARGDVYAFGAIVYAMLTGDPPYAAAGYTIDLARKLTEPPPSVRVRRAHVPEALDALVRTCLARVPADRFASGSELVAALGHITL